MKKVLDRVLPLLLFIFIGFCVADLLILSYRDLMLPKQPPPTKPKKRDSLGVAGRGTYSSITARNIFNVDRVIPPVILPEGQDPTKQQDAKPVPSSLPLTLTGTIVHSNPAKSIASIEMKGKNLVQSYLVDEEIESIAKITKISRGMVVFRNLNNNRMEFIELKPTGQKLSFDGSPTLASAPAAGGTDVRQIAPNKFEINRSDLNKYLSDMGSILQQAAMVPRKNANGEIECFKFVAIQPGSIFSNQLKFQNGDCIKAVNGEAVTSPQQAMQLYQNLKNAPTIDLVYERNGKDENSNFTIR